MLAVCVGTAPTPVVDDVMLSGCPTSFPSRFSDPPQRSSYKVSALVLVPSTCVASVLCVRLAGGNCGGGRCFVGLVHFSVDVILLRDTGTLERVRWFGRAAVFGWLGSCRHWRAGRWVHIAINRSTWACRGP